MVCFVVMGVVVGVVDFVVVEVVGFVVVVVEGVDVVVGVVDFVVVEVVGFVVVVVVGVVVGVEAVEVAVVGVSFGLVEGVRFKVVDCLCFFTVMSGCLVVETFCPLTQDIIELPMFLNLHHLSCSNRFS